MTRLGIKINVWIDRSVLYEVEDPAEHKVRLTKIKICSIKVAKSTRCYEIDFGQKQGISLAPTLFNVALDLIRRKI